MKSTALFTKCGHLADWRTTLHISWKFFLTSLAQCHWTLCKWGSHSTWGSPATDCEVQTALEDGCARQWCLEADCIYSHWSFSSVRGVFLHEQAWSEWGYSTTVVCQPTVDWQASYCLHLFHPSKHWQKQVLDDNIAYSTGSKWVFLISWENPPMISAGFNQEKMNTLDKMSALIDSWLSASVNVQAECLMKAGHIKFLACTSPVGAQWWLDSSE